MSSSRSFTRLPVVLIAVLAAAPLAWGACSEPPPASTPQVSISAPGGASSPEDGQSATPASPRPAGAGAAASLDRPTKEAIDREIAKLPPVRKAQLTYEDCRSIEQPTRAAIALAYKVSVACKADSDCESAADGTRCIYGGCGTAVSKSHKAAYDAALKSIGDAACPAWDAGDCQFTIPPAVPSCSPPAVACRAGRCERN